MLLLHSFAGRTLRLLAWLIFATAVCPVHAGSLDPVTITFGTGSRDFGNKGPATENGYRYEAFGNSWVLINTNLQNFGQEGTALLTFYGLAVSVGNIATFRREDHAPFQFHSISLRGRLEGYRNDVVLARGYLGGIEVATQTLQSSNEIWRTDLAVPTFSGPIDEFRLYVSEDNGSALMFDNLVLASVPEPTTWAFLATGGTFLLLARRNRKK